MKNNILQSNSPLRSIRLKRDIIKSFISILINTLLLVGCNLKNVSKPTAAISPSPFFTPSPTPTQPPTFEATATIQTPYEKDTGWVLFNTGLERRIIDSYDQKNNLTESLYILRVNPNDYQLDVAYHEYAQTLEDWQTETNALAVINGGYFRKEDELYFPNGLTITNGEKFGESYGSFAGMLAINENFIKLRWLQEEPYKPNENLTAALQSFPVLVKPGGELGFTAENEDNIKARRTMIGQDTQGRIIFLVTSKASYTLHQLSLYLTKSDLNLDVAFNLDGGPSSGILLSNPQETVPAQSLLPFVILVYPR